MPERFAFRGDEPAWKRIGRGCCSYHCLECKKLAFEILNNNGHALRKVRVRIGAGYTNDMVFVERKFKGTSYRITMDGND